MEKRTRRGDERRKRGKSEKGREMRRDWRERSIKEDEREMSLKRRGEKGVEDRWERLERK